MNIRKFIALTVVVGINLFSNYSNAESSVWKVSKGGGYFYLGGTIHVLSADDYPLPKEFISAYTDSSKIILETDLVATGTPEFQQKYIAAMTYNDGRSLESELQPEIYRKLQQFMQVREIPLATFSKFQPWGMMLMITMFEYQRLGMMPEYGVDLYFNNLALTDKKTVEGLETPAEQLSFLQSMEKIDPNKGIEYTLRDLEQLPEFIKIMKQSWRSGELESTYLDEVLAQMVIDFPEVYKTLIASRNNAWMKHLVKLNGNKEKEFVLVGAMHLSGKEGLLQKLQAQGFKVEQL